MYLGVTIDKTLSWNSHIDMMTKRANQTISFVPRNLSTRPRDIKEASYKTLVRPQVKYAATVWDPSSKDGINKAKATYRDAQQDSARMATAEPAVSPH